MANYIDRQTHWAGPERFPRDRRRDTDRHLNGTGQCILAGQVDDTLHHAEIRDLDVVADEKEIVRLHIEMLQVVLQIHQVEHFGRFAGNFSSSSRNAAFALLLVLRGTVPPDSGRPIP